MVPEEWPIAAEPADHAVDSVRARGQSRFEILNIDVVRSSLDVDEDRHGAILDDRRHGGREARGLNCPFLRSNTP
jgi:hypothetical protein